MLIEIRELEEHPIDFDEQYAPGVIDLLPEVVQKTPLHGAGRAQLVEEHHGKRQIIQDIRLDGSLRPAWSCLVPAVLSRWSRRLSASSICFIALRESMPARKSFP
jgi:hypothetical protein